MSQVGADLFFIGCKH